MTTARYIDFPKKSCPGVSSPCWIPQANSVIHDHVANALPHCDSIEKYSCMLDTLRRAGYENIDKQCIKSCKSESYKIMSTRNTLDSFANVSKNFLHIDLVLIIDFLLFRKGKPGKYMLR